MAAPVEMRGQVVGLLNVDSTKTNAFSETDEARLVDMASEAAQWLELAWEIDQLRLKSRQLTSLVDIAQMIISETNLDQILDQITVQTAKLSKSRICSVFLLNEDGSELVLRACHGGTKLYREKPNLSTEDSAARQRAHAPQGDGGGRCHGAEGLHPDRHRAQGETRLDARRAAHLR